MFTLFWMLKHNFWTGFNYFLSFTEMNRLVYWSHFSSIFLISLYSEANWGESLKSENFIEKFLYLNRHLFLICFPYLEKVFSLNWHQLFIINLVSFSTYLTLKRMECCHVLVKLKKCVHTKILSSPSVSLDPISVPNPNPKAINLAQSHVPPPIWIIVLYQESQSKVQVSELLKAKF